MAQGHRGNRGDRSGPVRPCPRGRCLARLCSGSASVRDRSPRRAFLAAPADGVAAARGRDARALRRPRLARRRGRARDARARRRAAPLPARVGRRAPRVRARRPPARLGRVRARRACRSSRCSGRDWPDAQRALVATALVAGELGCSSSTASTGGCTACSCSCSLACTLRAARARSTAAVAAVGALGRRRRCSCVAAHPYGALRARPRRRVFVLVART